MSKLYMAGIVDEESSITLSQATKALNVPGLTLVDPKDYHVTIGVTDKDVTIEEIYNLSKMEYQLATGTLDFLYGVNSKKIMLVLRLSSRAHEELTNKYIDNSSLIQHVTLGTFTPAPDEVDEYDRMVKDFGMLAANAAAGFAMRPRIRGIDQNTILPVRINVKGVYTKVPNLTDFNKPYVPMQLLADEAFKELSKQFIKLQDWLDMNDLSIRFSTNVPREVNGFLSDVTYVCGFSNNVDIKERNMLISPTRFSTSFASAQRDFIENIRGKTLVRYIDGKRNEIEVPTHLVIS